MEGLRHAEVVASIKAREDEARLLVVDPETDEHFKRLRVTPTEEHVEGGPQPGAQGGCGVVAEQPLTRCPHRSSAITRDQRNQPCPGEKVGCPRDTRCFWGYPGPTEAPFSLEIPFLEVW